MTATEKPGSFEIGGSKARYVLVICSLLSAIRYADWQVMSVVIEPIKLAFNLSDAQMGLINSAYFLGIILFSIPVAYLVDVWSRKKVIGIIAIVWSVFTLGTGFSGGFLILFLMRLGVGIGEAGFAPGGTALVSASYPETHRARKLGVFNLFITLGVIVGVVGGGVLSAHFGGWRTPFYVFGIPGMILGGLAFLMQDYQLAAADGKALKRDSFVSSLSQLLRIRTLRWLYVGLGSYAVLQISIGTWFPTLLIRAYGIKEDKAGLVMGIVTLLGLAGPILGGLLADRWERHRPGGRMRLAAASIVLASAFVWLILIAGFDIGNRTLMMFCAAMMPLHSIFVGMALPAVSATTQAVVPAHLRGLAWGTAVVALYLLGGAWGPWLVGSISDHIAGSYQGLTIGLAATGLFGVLAGAIWWHAASHVEQDTSFSKGISR